MANDAAAVGAANGCQFECLVGLAALFAAHHPATSSLKLKTLFWQCRFVDCGNRCLRCRLWGENGVRAEVRRG